MKLFLSNTHSLSAVTLLGIIGLLSPGFVLAQQWEAIPSQGQAAKAPFWSSLGEAIQPQSATAWMVVEQQNKPELPKAEQLENNPADAVDKPKVIKTAYSRGSLIQVGDVIYPNLGYNALQRQPGSWGNAAIAAIDNSFQGYGSATACKRGDFTASCADALAEIYGRLWNSKAFSLDLQWTIHSLSGGDVSFAGRKGGTSFGEGQSLGFKLSKNITPSLGLTFGANRLIHLDQTTDLPKNLYLMATQIVRTNQKSDSPIFSFSLGIMTDVWNPNTNIGTIEYPKWLRGGEYPSIFGEIHDKRKASSGRGYYPNVAGTSSAYVCANQSIFAGKPLGAESPNCIKQVLVGPIGSIGFAPWPWLGFYAIYEGNLNLGVSVKPITNLPWTISLQAVQPFSGINKFDDDYIRDYPCRGENFNTCRTRVGLFTDFSF